jgi:hypothetical protein
MRLQSRAQERINRKLTLEWYTSLMGCFPLSAMAMGFFPLEQGEKM